MVIMSIELFGLENIPIIDGNSNISLIIKQAIEKQGCGLNHGDIILIAETLISKAEENFIKLDELTPSQEAIDLASKSGKDPKLVQAILDESNEVVRVGPNFVITETKHGFVCANAGIDESNVGDGLVLLVLHSNDAILRIFGLDKLTFFDLEGDRLCCLVAQWSLIFCQCVCAICQACDFEFFTQNCVGFAQCF